MLYVLLIIVILFFILDKILSQRTENVTISIKNTNLDNYTKKNYVMTQTELKFYRELKKVTDKLELTIFPQVKLDTIIDLIKNNHADRNRIKFKSIDFTIVNNINCKIVCCIELDDYTHNYNKRIKRDNFVNKLFETVGLKLIRIKVNNYYNLEEIEKTLKENMNAEHRTLGGVS